ncbi:MAG: hypothetical protein ACR2FY_11220 [Pirellulaceae bacterium]
MTTGKNVPAIGFLTVTEHAEHGLFGGYLILNVSGRPLEFHCTAPLKPSRAQEILYGPTLRPFLFGEQIGQTLLAKSRVKPFFVCTDAEPMLAAREFSDVPLLLVQTAEDEHPSTRHGEPFALGRRKVFTAPAHTDDRSVALEKWSTIHADALDLLEPFTRIREALEEAQKTVRPSPVSAAA